MEKKQNKTKMSLHRHCNWLTPSPHRLQDFIIQGQMCAVAQGEACPTTVVTQLREFLQGQGLASPSSQRALGLEVDDLSKQCLLFSTHQQHTLPRAVCICLPDLRALPPNHPSGGLEDLQLPRVALLGAMVQQALDMTKESRA